MKSVKSNESRITGSWEFVNGKMTEDSNCLRIQYLIKHELRQVSSDESGWNTFYYHEGSKTYWKLTYPKSELHSGGPPELIRIENLDELNKKHE